MRLGDATLIADPSGVLLWPAQDLLVVADLHLEKGSARARQGALLPPYDSRATLVRLATVLGRWAPRRVISLGDGFHDPDALGRMGAPERALLAALTRRHDWLWLTGNHDPVLPAGLSGASADRLELAGLVFQHAPGMPAAGFEIAGHLHPAVSLATRGRRLLRPCFVADRQRILLPAFGSYTGGLDLRHAAVAGLFGSGYRAYVLGPRRIHVIGRQAIEPPRR